MGQVESREQELSGFLELKRDELRKQELSLRSLQKENQGLEYQDNMRREILNHQVSLIEQQQAVYLKEWEQEVSELRSVLAEEQRQMQVIVSFGLHDEFSSVKRLLW